MSHRTYYRIVARGEGDELTALAILMPHWREGRPPSPKRKVDDVLTDHLVSIRDIRQRTGIDLFLDVTGERKRRLEEAVATELWPRN